MMYHLGNVIYAAILVSLAHDAAAVIATFSPYLFRAWMVLVCTGMAIGGFGCLFVIVFLWGLWDAIRAEQRATRARRRGRG